MTDKTETKKRNGLVTIGETDYFKVDDCYVPISETFDIGTCICYGGIMKICRFANIIHVFCENNPECNFECSRKDECTGIDHCVNKKNFSDEFIERSTSKIGELIENALDQFDVILITSNPESRKVVAENYFCNVWLSTSEIVYENMFLIKIVVSDREKYESSKAEDIEEIGEILEDVEKVLKNEDEEVH